jgi:hypothetical protein
MTHKCQYCEKEFRKESTLFAHMCEQKRRMQQEKETGVQLGFMAYLRFYDITQGSSKFKTYAEFSSSSLYNAFVKYGRYLVSIKAINVNSFTEWLIKNNKKIDVWCKDSVYEEWLREYLKKESPTSALERGLKEMEDYARDSDIDHFSHYFKYGNNSRICHHITTGRVSPWVIYNCDSGVEWLGTLSEDLVVLVISWIDPDFWDRKFKNYTSDTEWCKHILKEAGL